MAEKYTHISQGMREMMLGIGATDEQFKTSDKKAKANIDGTLHRYLTNIPKIRTVLVGEDGPGKDFIGRALLNENGCHGARPANRIDDKSVIKNGLEIIVVNTPGSWQMKVPQDQPGIMTFFIFVIDSKSQTTMPAELNQSEVEKVEDAIALGRFVIADGQADPGENHPLYRILKSDKVVRFNIESEQTLDSTQQDIIYKMLLNAAISSQSCPEHPTSPNMQQEENKGAAQEDLGPPGDTHTYDDDESGDFAVIHVEHDKKENPADKVHVGDQNNLKNLGKVTIPNAIPEESESEQSLGNYGSLDSWDTMEDCAESVIPRAKEMKKESGEAQKELLILKLLDVLQSGMHSLSVATPSATIGTVVIGVTGSDKSATANTLLGENEGEHFLEGSSAVYVTTESAEKSTMENGVRLTIVDTPGSWETSFEVKKVENAFALGRFVIADRQADPGENHPLYRFLESDNVVRFNIGSEQSLDSTQQDIICKMLLKAAISSQSCPEHPTSPSMPQEENKGASQEDLGPPGDTPTTNDDDGHITSSVEGRGITVTPVKQDKNVDPADEVPVVVKRDENNSERNSSSDRTISNNASPGESERGQAHERSEETLDSSDMVTTEELQAEAPLVMSGATEMEKEPGAAQKEQLITKLLVALQSLSVATSSATTGTVVIGATGSGKSATANTLLGENEEEHFLEGSSAVSVTTKSAEKSTMENGVCLTVVDTPGSWETSHTPKVRQSKNVYVFVINLASPRFDSETLTTLENIKDNAGNPIVKSGRFVVALSHADSALQNTTLEGYLEEINGDPLHTFLTGDAKGKVIALNNAAETQYQRDAHRQVLLSRVLLASSKMGTPTSKSWLSWWWHWVISKFGSYLHGAI